MSLSPRTSLVLITALFVGPLLGAWLMYAGVIDFQPSGTRNLGELVQPPVPIDWESLEASGEDTEFLKHWVILKPVQGACDESCRAELLDLRQVHRASGRNQSRIELAVVFLDKPAPEDLAWLEENYALYRDLYDSGSTASSALAQAGTGSVYLVDPLGNIMMRYESGSDPNKLKQDLKRLLKWSKLDDSQ